MHNVDFIIIKCECEGCVPEFNPRIKERTRSILKRKHILIRCLWFALGKTDQQSVSRIVPLICTPPSSLNLVATTWQFHHTNLHLVDRGCECLLACLSNTTPAPPRKGRLIKSDYHYRGVSIFLATSCRCPSATMYLYFSTTVPIAPCTVDT